jgi:hypothetical protein
MISGAVAIQGARRDRGIGGAPPTISISGTVKHGETLTATAADYTSLQWYAGASAISGETATTYVVDRTDTVLGPNVTCRATNAHGSTDSNALVYDYTAITSSRSWWDVATGVTLADGDTTVDAITDRMSNNNIAAPTSSNRPAYSSSDADFGNQPSMAFDGSSDYLKKTAFSWGSSVTAFSLLFVVKLTTNTNGQRVFSYGSSSILINQSTTNRFTWSTAGTGVTPATAMNTAQSMVETYDQSNIRIYSNNSLVGGPTAEVDSITDSQDFAIGGSLTGTFLSAFKTPLFGLVKAVMSSDELADFDSYVSWRFGV